MKNLFGLVIGVFDRAVTGADSAGFGDRYSGPAVAFEVTRGPELGAGWLPKPYFTG